MRSTALALTASSLIMPRAIAGGRVRGDGNTATLIEQISAAVTEMRTNMSGRIDTLEAAARDHSVQTAGLLLNGSANASMGLVRGGPSPSAAFAALPVDPTYNTAFASFVRSGGQEDVVREANATGDRARIQAAMSTGSNPDGGYLAPVEWDRRIQQAQVAISPLRTIATVRPTAVGAFSTLWNNNQWGSGWVGETANRPATTSAQLAPLIFAAGEIYANVAITQRLLDDSAIDLEEWISGQVSTEFSRQEGIAFVSGDGNNKPAGFLTYVTGGANDAALYTAGNTAKGHPGGNLDVVPSGAASDLTVDGIINLQYGLAAPYRANAVWYMSSMTAAAVTKMKDTTGRLLWRESVMAGQPATLLGRPVVLDESMPSVTAGNTPIAFGDFATGYLINDRLGVRVLRDPYTNKPYVMMYVTKRVGGGVLDPRAIRLLKIGAN